jgi:hypothetical protein
MTPVVFARNIPLEVAEQARHQTFTTGIGLLQRGQHGWGMSDTGIDAPFLSLLSHAAIFSTGTVREKPLSRGDICRSPIGEHWPTHRDRPIFL